MKSIATHGLSSLASALLSSVGISVEKAALLVTARRMSACDRFNVQERRSRMSFFRKLWQDLENGEWHAGALEVDLGSVGLILLLLLFGGGKKHIEIFWH